MELRRIYVRIAKESGINNRFLTYKFVAEQIEKYEAPRFYITEHVACLLVCSYYKGQTSHKSKIKQAMVKDLVSVYEEITEKHPNALKFEIWERVVNHPAKSFYMTQGNIIDVLSRHSYYNKKKRKSAQ